MSVVTIACDESGSEGENLMGSHHQVFVHASTCVSLDLAESLMADLRRATRSQAVEVKSKVALAQHNRSALIEFLNAIGDAGNIHLVDKAYFVVAKMVDVTLSPDGVAGLAGLARQWADLLHTLGPGAVGSQRWNNLLTTFNRLIRSYLRQGSTPPQPRVFFDSLEEARAACEDPTVEALLSAIWDARRRVLKLATAGPLELREIDPMGPALTAVAMTWCMRLGNVPMEFVADNYSGLNDVLRDAIITAARLPLEIAGHSLPRPDIRSIRLVDSRSDARVQVADVLGGVGRELADLASAGTFDDALQIAAKDLLDYNAMCSTGSPIDRLIDIHTPSYAIGLAGS